MSQSTINSVAQYIFTSSNGGTYLCTGTLLNSASASSASFYFLTAHHCIGQASEAATMEFYWLFQRPYCGAPDPTTVARTTGGATLLSTGSSTDYSLVKLNEPPPAGVGLSGWDARQATQGDHVVVIHHPRGDLKKISEGDVVGFATLNGNIAVLNGSNNTHIAVHWFAGVTEPGSSGSGLWKDEGGSWYLIGQLTGGASSCTNPDALDFFGRFDLTFPFIKTYLTRVAPTPAGDSVGLFSSSNGQWYLDGTGEGVWNGCATDTCGGPFGIAGDIPIAGDWNGDGHDQIGTYDPRTGWFALDINGNRQWDSGDVSFSFGNPAKSDIPIVGDWNGDGHDQIGVFRPSLGWILDLNGDRSWSGCGVDACYVHTFGIRRDIPIVGDWNGDGRDQIGTYDPQTGWFALDLNGDHRWDSGDVSFPFGNPADGDIPVVGDWNGDGRDEVGVYRPGVGWRLDRDGSRSWSGCGVDACYTFAVPGGNQPVVGRW